MSAVRVNLKVLQVLLSARSPMPVEAIGRAASLTPLAAASAIEALAHTGCTFEMHPQHGVRLIASGLGCWADYIEPRHPGALGRRLVVYRQTTSTQDLARSLIASGPGLHEGTIIVADHQTSGRGRLGRRWLAASGEALLMTAIVRQAGATVDRLMLASCCGLARAVEDAAGVSVQIRWPNDLLIDGAKIAGILVETAGHAAMIGIGLNVSGEPRALPPEPRSPTRRTTSLHAHGRTIDRLQVLDVIATELDRALRWGDDRSLITQWKQRATLLQKRVAVLSQGVEITGRVIDLDPEAGLLMQTDAGAMVTLPAATTSLIAE